MLNLFDSYTTQSRDLHFSLLLDGYKHPTVAIKDDGWLPADVESPLKFIFKQAGVELSGKGRYFNQIDVPHFWEIDASGNDGRVLDKGQLRAHLNYVRQDNTRLVRSVEWYDRAGRIRLIEGYNQWGWKFRQTVRNAAGQDMVTTYLTDRGAEVLTENHFTGVLIYNDPKGKKRFFKDWPALVSYYLRQAGFDLKRVIINSLGAPFFTLLQVLDATEQNYLFWQEEIQGGIPGNMQFILDGNAGKTQVVVQQRHVFDHIEGLLAPNNRKKVSYLGYSYPFARLNQGHRVAVTFTNSDQLEKITELITALPEITFNIAAGTEMSGKLMALDRFSNVNLFPTVSRTNTDILTKEADLYLDINRGNEIFDAVRGAFENNMVIMGFADTLHQARYVAEENTFQEEQVDQMVAKLKKVTEDPQELEKTLQAQWQHADRVLPKDYQKLFG